MNALFASCASFLATPLHYLQSNPVYLACLAVFAAVSISFMGTGSKADPYGLFHLALNKRPGEDPGLPPPTEWLNMGYWKGTNDFREACEALAVKLVHASKYQPGSRVLDVGHGTGESLILQLSSASIPKPRSLAGITSLELHYKRASNRVRRLQANDQSAAAVAVELYHGDAVYRVTSKDHPLDPSSDGEFDSILALDCAYHFNTREAFLDQCFQKLAKDGRLALADICFSEGSLQRRSTRAILRLLRVMPMENVVSPKEYVEIMEKIGFSDVELEDISADVFPGFTTFLKQRGLKWWIFGHVMGWLSALGARFVVVSGRRD
ncbi:hypothetical protein HGRIS_007843 [Hohenbuehelia grisea]|uniref:S-adenosyl-L-methionine-dependent methyltransferase n=1 Tax=Hohenbuehelia grisea TaxID=104357 RepID=A0ABR3J632_9AGAR